MKPESTIQYYRAWYRKLIRFYPKPYYERFGESMEQTFSDSLREHAKQNPAITRHSLWMIAETSSGILKEHFYCLTMQNRILRLALIVALLLLIPLFGNRYVDGWNWSPFDFLFAGVLLFGTGVAYEIMTRKSSAFTYRAAVGIGCLATLLLTWVNAAVGIIGDGPVNTFYLILPLIGIIGAIVTRLRAEKMPSVLFIMAITQMLIPTIALIALHPPFSPGILQVFGLNAFFALLFTASGVLFRQSVRK